MLFYNFKNNNSVSHRAFKFCFIYWIILDISVNNVLCSEDKNKTDVMYAIETVANLDFDVQNSVKYCNQMITYISNLKFIFDKYKEPFKNDLKINEAIDSFQNDFCDINNRTNHVLKSCLLSLDIIQKRINEISDNYIGEASEVKQENYQKMV